MAYLFFPEKNQYTNIMYKLNLNCSTDNIKHIQKTHQDPNKIGFGVRFFQEYLQKGNKKKKLYFKPVRGSRAAFFKIQDSFHSKLLKLRYFSFLFVMADGMIYSKI